MAKTPKQEKQSFINVLSSDGTFRQVVTEDTPGAVRRDWESADGKSSGTKWELVYQDVSGQITGLSFHEGDFGKNILVEITDGDDVDVVSLGTATPFGEDFMKKLPALDLSLPVTLAPYAFDDEKTGKTRKGVTVTQADKKIQNFFYDFAKKESINGYPVPKFKKNKDGSDKPFSKDEWKLYFATARQFLIEYIEEHMDVKQSSAPQEDTAEATPDEVFEQAF